MTELVFVTVFNTQYTYVEKVNEAPEI